MGVTTDLSFDRLPSFANPICQDSPHLFADFHVLSGDRFEFDPVPFFGVAPFHEPFVSFAAGVGSLAGEVRVGDGLPVQPFGSCIHENLIVVWSPDRR